MPEKKALTRRCASTSPASGRGAHQLTALLITPRYDSNKWNDHSQKV